MPSGKINKYDKQYFDPCINMAGNWKDRINQQQGKNLKRISKNKKRKK